MKKAFIAILVLIVIAGVGFKARELMKEREQEIVNEPLPQKEQISVSLTKAKNGSMRDIRQYLAIVQPTKDIKISTKMAGYIENIFVEESQHVKKGELLATIDDSDINSNISLLETNLIQQQNDLALAKQIYTRNRKLFAVGGLAKEQLDTSKVILEGKKSAIKATKQKIAQLQEQKTYLSIKAPFDGEIDKLLMHQGDLAVTGKPILSMSNGDKKLIFSFVPSKDNIEKSQDIYIDEQKIGQVSKILTLAKQGLVQAEVKLDKKLNLPIGATVNIGVLVRSEEGCIVPNTALLHKEDGVYVMVYKDSKFSAQKINLVMSQKNQEMITPCPTDSIATGSEVLLAKLPIYGEVEIR
ncbi:MAG: efflux RND transporter periplasmic adaptor subunit [Epsilonproteobacteria bacterium]|nr:efflux RND transporter periplasmic adaptor subunit [Campylobacterota bacterium]